MLRSSGEEGNDRSNAVGPRSPVHDLHLGFGDRQIGWTVPRIASAWAELMKRLGYTRWAAQGGDWAWTVTGTEKAAALGVAPFSGILLGMLEES